MTHFFQSVIQSWKAAVAPLTQMHARYLIGEVIHIVCTIYASLAVGAWWVLALLMLSFVVSPAASSFLQTLLFFVVLCAARSSVGMKNTAYFIEKMMHYFLIYWLGTFMVMRGLTMLSTSSFLGSFLFQVVSLHCSAFLTLFGLFLVDSGFWLYPIVESPIRAMRMLVYNYPVYIGIELLRLLLQVVGAKLIEYTVDTKNLSFFSSQMLDLGLWLAIIPLYVAFVTVVYIRRVYEQGKYY